MKSERQLYAEARGQAESRLVDYIQSGKDPAFAFQAYLCWRVASPLKDAAIDAMCAEQIQLATSVGNEPDVRSIEKKRRDLLRQFDQLQEAVLQVIEEIAVERVKPSDHGLARANRFRAAYLTAEEARRRQDAGSTQIDVYQAVAERMGLSAANVRKLVDGFHNDAGTQLAADRAFEVLRNRLKERRRRPPPNKKRLGSEHLWRK